jgi:hypothetical protein
MDYLLRDTVGGGSLLESAVGDQSSICYSNSCTGSFQPIGEISFGGGRLKPLLGNTSRDDSTLPRTLAVVLGPAGGVGTVARAAACPESVRVVDIARRQASFGGRGAEGRAMPERVHAKYRIETRRR